MNRPAEGNLPSSLAHFDPADLLDALSTGIVMLDAQLCMIICAPRDTHSLDVTVTLLLGQITGPHLLLELVDRVERQLASCGDP